MSVRTSHMGNALLVANYPSDVGYAWWLMENFWVEISNIVATHGYKSFLAYPLVREIPDSIKYAPIEVMEIAFTDESPTKERLVLEFVEANAIKFVYLSDRPYRSSLYKNIRRKGVEIIVNHDHSPGYPTLISKLLRLPRNFVYRRSQSACDRYIAVSQFVYQKMVGLAGLPEERCRVVQNGIPPACSRGSDRLDYRNILNLPGDAFLIITVGRASVYKGIDFLIDCAHNLIVEENMSDLYFIFCGDGPDLERFRNMVADRSLQGRFHCLGHRTDIRDILLDCNLAIHASPSEACSLSILEYMSAGLAILAPPVGGNIEQLTDNETGMFYQFRNKADLVAKIRFLYENPQIRQTIGVNAASVLGEKFSLELMNRRFREVIIDALGCSSDRLDVDIT